MEESQEDYGTGPITATGKADQESLGDLHGVIAEYLTLKLRSGKASAAEVAVAVGFLRNNSITADPAKNAALMDLSETLKRRNRSGRAITKDALEAADAQFSALMGTMGAH